MTNNIKKWFEKNIEGVRITKSTEGKDMVFVPNWPKENYGQYEKAIRYLKKIKANYKYEFRANYNTVLFEF